jgi:hypothetical protein
MTWLRAFIAFFQAVGSLMAWMRERQQRDAGALDARAQDRKIQDERIAKALAARRAAESGGMPDDDPYRRD